MRKPADRRHQELHRTADLPLPLSKKGHERTRLTRPKEPHGLLDSVVRQRLALLHLLALEHQLVLRERNQLGRSDLLLHALHRISAADVNLEPAQQQAQRATLSTVRRIAPTKKGNEKLQELTAALRGLPETQRSALTLCHYSGFSNKEAASIMNISVKALESAISRAKRSLRKALSNRTKISSNEAGI